MDQLLEHRIAKNLTTFLSIISVCAWCNKVKAKEGEGNHMRHVWLDAENHVHSQSDEAISHGICPDCKTDLLESCANYFF